MLNLRVLFACATALARALRRAGGQVTRAAEKLAVEHTQLQEAQRVRTAPARAARAGRAQGGGVSARGAVRGQVLEEALDRESERTEALVAEYKLKRRSLTLLADRDANLAGLREESAASAQRLLELGAEWERFRAPLVDALRERKRALLARRDDVRHKLDSVARMRDEAAVVQARAAPRAPRREMAGGESTVG